MRKMTQSHYSLRWHNHQSHITSSFDTLLQTESLVDVTLVCEETSIRAHKVVLSACSPFFQRIFSENPCKHPVIVLKDFRDWEVLAIIQFIYKGEVSIAKEQLQNLLKAGSSLQVRGLALPDDFGIDKESRLITNQTPTPSNSPNDYDRNFYQTGRFPTPGITVRTPGERTSPFSPLPIPNYESPLKSPHMSHLSFPETLIPRQDCQSPIPRRKQARPRRRSGELCGAQDLSTNPANKAPSPMEETAENLCMKKPNKEDRKMKEIERTKTPEPMDSPELDLSTHHKDFTPSPPLSLPPILNMKPDLESHSPLHFPPMPSVSALTMTPPHSKFFGLDSPLGLFPPGLDGCRNPLLEMADPRTTPESQLFAKKKMGRPKGQHSAPRGGPPRSWTNAELTEALQHVWNKKMTTSQASRIFGIPYNSLLMYVRGKYGKSLKLEQLRKDCIGAPGTPMDLMTMTGNNNNNPCKNDREPDTMQPGTRPSSTEEANAPQPMFNPFAQNFYPDFAGFPIPVSMLHLLPQSEKNRDHYRQQPTIEDNCKNDRVKEEPQDLFMSAALPCEDRRELVQQNGQD